MWEEGDGWVLVLKRLSFINFLAIMALTLPQPDVPVFTGDPVEYCDFNRVFENLIERKTSSPSTRLYYLLQYTSGQVQDLVRSCQALQEDRGYKEEATKSLQRTSTALSMASQSALKTVQHRRSSRYCSLAVETR